MPLIFFVSGAGTYFAMQSRGRTFLMDRFKRLLIPFFFGILILIPPQKYYEYLFNQNTYLSFKAFLQIYPNQLTNANNGWNLTWFGLLGYHIWYLPYLFVQTLFALPLFRWLLKRKLKEPFLSFHIYWLFIPLILINIILRPFFPQYLHWADFAHFFFFFVLGFYFVKFRQQITPQLLKSLKWFVAIAIITSLLTHYFALFSSYMIKWMDRPDSSWDYIGFLVIRSTNSLAWMWSFVGLFILYFDKKHSILPKLNEAVLPIYLLHQTFIIAFGFYIVKLSWPMFLKFGVILLLSIVAMLFTYTIIKRVKPLRFLFGMKNLKFVKYVKQNA
ncbi:hypothetical protein BKI52_30525 [marine bacterium AO1-C]|nr:hypothetical protein BKI52_30525 [marine bacterium AO1-C]